MGQPTALISPHLSQDVKFLEKPNFKRARSELAAHEGEGAWEAGRYEGKVGGVAQNFQDLLLPKASLHHFSSPDPPRHSAGREPHCSGVSSALSSLGSQASAETQGPLNSLVASWLGAHELSRILHKYLGPEKKTILALKHEQMNSNIKINKCLTK